MLVREYIFAVIRKSSGHLMYTMVTILNDNVFLKYVFARRIDVKCSHHNLTR
jgi:hypothetical protein